MTSVGAGGMVVAVGSGKAAGLAAGAAVVDGSIGVVVSWARAGAALASSIVRAAATTGRCGMQPSRTTARQTSPSNILELFQLRRGCTWGTEAAPFTTLRVMALVGEKHKPGIPSQFNPLGGRRMPSMRSAHRWRYGPDRWKWRSSPRLPEMISKKRLEIFYYRMILAAQTLLCLNISSLLHLMHAIVISNRCLSEHEGERTWASRAGRPKPHRRSQRGWC